MKPPHARYLLLCVLSGCTATTPPAPVAPPREEPMQPALAPAATEISKPRPDDGARQPAVREPPAPIATAKPPAPIATAKPPAAPVHTAPTAKPAASPTPVLQSPAAPPLDLNALKEQLKDTNAIGVITKLSLKNQVDDLLQQFRDFYDGKTKVTLQQLRRSYDALLMKVLSLVQDKDTKLATSIAASREPIWGLLSDPKKFAALQV